MQWSVFECRLRPHQLHRLRQRLEHIAEPTDSLRLWALPQRAAEPVQLGREVALPVWQDKVI
jgi:CRISPR-associated protein Cas2